MVMECLVEAIKSSEKVFELSVNSILGVLAGNFLMNKFNIEMKLINVIQ